MAVRILARLLPVTAIDQRGAVTAELRVEQSTKVIGYYHTGELILAGGFEVCFAISFAVHRDALWSGLARYLDALNAGGADIPAPKKGMAQAMAVSFSKASNSGPSNRRTRPGVWI